MWWFFHPPGAHSQPRTKTRQYFFPLNPERMWLRPVHAVKGCGWRPLVGITSFITFQWDDGRLFPTKNPQEGPLIMLVKYECCCCPSSGAELVIQQQCCHLHLRWCYFCWWGSSSWCPFHNNNKKMTHKARAMGSGEPGCGFILRSCLSFSSLSLLLLGSLFPCLFAFLSLLLLLLFTVPASPRSSRQAPKPCMKTRGEGKWSVNKALRTYLLEPVILSAQS